jgi:hypothetical protein
MGYSTLPHLASRLQRHQGCCWCSRAPTRFADAAAQLIRVRRCGRWTALSPRERPGEASSLSSGCWLPRSGALLHRQKVAAPTRGLRLLPCSPCGVDCIGTANQVAIWMFCSSGAWQTLQTRGHTSGRWVLQLAFSRSSAPHTGHMHTNHQAFQYPRQNCAPFTASTHMKPALLTCMMQISPEPCATSGQKLA